MKVVKPSEAKILKERAIKEKLLFKGKKLAEDILLDLAEKQGIKIG